MAWVSGKLIVEVRDRDYCAGSSVADVSYSLRDERIVHLQWIWAVQRDKAGRPETTKCGCDKNIRFELSNLAVRDYKIILDKKQ